MLNICNILIQSHNYTYNTLHNYCQVFNTMYVKKVNFPENDYSIHLYINIVTFNTLSF